MCFSCRYSSLVSPSSSRRHGLFPRRAHAIYRSLAFRAGPVHQPFASIMTVRGMRRIQASKSAALRCLVIGPSFFDPSKYIVRYKGRGSCCCRCTAKDLISDPWIPSNVHVSPQSWKRKVGGAARMRRREKERESGKKAIHRGEHLTFMIRNIV